MKTRELASICFCILAITGISLNLDFYQNTIQPLNLMTEDLDEIIDSSNVSQIQTNLTETKHNLFIIMENLPESKNPVWFYPTESTDLLRIEKDLDRMIISLDKLSDIQTDTSAYHVGMMDINDRASLIKENLLDARGFLYGSVTNVFFTLVWIIGVVGLTRMIRT